MIINALLFKNLKLCFKELNYQNLKRNNGTSEVSEINILSSNFESFHSHKIEHKELNAIQILNHKALETNPFLSVTYMRMMSVGPRWPSGLERQL